MESHLVTTVSITESSWRKVLRVFGKDEAAARSDDGFLEFVRRLTNPVCATCPESCTSDREAFWLGPVAMGRAAAAADPRLGCLAAPGGSDLCLVARRDATCIDIGRLPERLSPADLAHLACLLRRSQAGALQMLRYDQDRIFADPWLPAPRAWTAYGGLLRELRDTVWDWHRGEVASLPWYKFVNLGEAPETGMDALVARAEAAAFVEGSEKMDGTFAQLRALPDGRVVLATSNVLLGAASAECDEVLTAIASIALAEGSGYLAIAQAHPHTTLMLELVDPAVDQKVIHYPPERQGLWLTGARDVRTGRLWRHEELERAAAGSCVPVPPLACTSLGEALVLAYLAEGTEGVVLSLGGELVKVKTGAYQRALHATGGAFRNVARAWAGGYLDDVVAGLPHEEAERSLATGARLSAYAEACKQALLLCVEQRTGSHDVPPHATLPDFLTPWLDAPTTSPARLILTHPHSSTIIDEPELLRREHLLHHYRAQCACIHLRKVRDDLGSADTCKLQFHT